MSDSSVGQIVGGIAGGAIGFFAGGPLGAVQGFSIGYGLGGAIDPPPGPTVRAPRLDDLTYQSSAYGTPIKTIYGTIGLHGNVIYLENGQYKEVVTKEEQGGKGGGGGATVETVSYYATFAVLLSEAIPNAAVKRIWLGGKLFYNAGSDDLGTIIQSNRRAGGFHLYDGTQTEPDARIEAVVGLDSAEAYVGSSYIIFYDLPLAEYGNSLTGAPVKLEMVTEKGAPELIGQYSMHLDLMTQTGGPGSFENDEFFIRSFLPTSVAMDQHRVVREQNIDDDIMYTRRWKNSSTDSWKKSTALTFGRSDIKITGGLNDLGAGTVTYLDELDTDLEEAGNLIRYNHRGSQWVGWTAQRNLLWGGALQRPIPETDHSTWDFILDEDQQYAYRIDNNNIYKYDDDLLLVGSFSHGLSVNRGFRLWHDSGILWVCRLVAAPGDSHAACTHFYRVSQNFSGLIFAFELPAPNHVPSDGSVPRSEFAVLGNVLYRAHAVGELPDSEIVYEQWAIERLVSVGAPLGDIVNLEMEKSGIPAALVDVTELTEISVRGYAVTPGDSRGSLGPLKAAFRFDIVPDGFGLKCLLRGGATKGVIPYGDLGAGMSGGDAPRLSVSREMDTQLPHRYEVSYADVDREYDTGMQYADYPTPSLNVRKEEFPIVFAPDEAAQLAEVLLDASHTERVSMEFSLPQTYLDVNPADVWTIEAPGRSYTVRFDLVTEEAGQVLQVQARLNNAISYQPAASGETGPTPEETIPLVDDAQTYLVDGPMITSEQDVPGYLAAMGAGFSWPGGVLQRSVDDGQSYTSVQAFSGPGSVAIARNALVENDSYALDYEGELIIEVEFGDFSSVSLSQMMAGSNYLAYGAEGRWEVIQYANATINPDTSISLTTLARGMHGTEWATGLHQSGDTVILLNDSDNAFVGADIARLGTEMLFRGVTNGQAVSEANTLTFTYQGVNLKPYAPRFLGGTVVGTDIEFTVESRTRYPSSFWYSGVQPQNESVMRLEADIMDGSSVVRTLTSSDGEFVYSEAQQVEDFGGPQTVVDVQVFQMSERVGRGYVRAASISLSPLPVAENLVAHYDATTLTGFSDDDDVALWGDQSASGWDLTDNGSPPAYKESASPSGLPAVEFDSSSGEYLQNTSANPTPGDSNRTIYVVGRESTSSANGNGILSFGSQSADGGGIKITNEIAVRVNGGYRLWDSQLGGSWFVLTIALNGDNADDLEAYLNGGLISPDETVSQSINTASRIELAGGGDPGGDRQQYDGLVGEIVIYDAYHSESDRDSVTDHLMEKWGI